MSNSRIRAMLEMSKKKSIEPTVIDKPKLTSQDIMNADFVYLESSLNVEELLSFNAQSIIQITSNTSEENIADNIVKEKNLNEESEIGMNYDKIHVSGEGNTSVVLNPKLSDNSEINAIDVNQVNEISAGKKRKIKPKKNNKLSREESKLKRMAGQEYVGFSRQGKNVHQDKLRNERKMKETCKSQVCIKSAFRQCQHFTESQREEIFQKFWACNWDEKRTYISNLVTKKEVNRTRVIEETSRRQNTYNYYLKYQNCDSLQVCKKMFIATLGLNEWMIHNWIKESIHGMPIQKSAYCTTQNNDEKNDHEIRSSINRRKLNLDAWIQSLPKMPSHYCRQHSNRIYLEGPFDTKEEVYNLYVQHCALFCFIILYY